MYRLSWPCAAFFADLGLSLCAKLNIHDDEANVYVATSPDLKGLVVEAETLDELEKEVRDLVPELLTLNMPKLHDKARTHVSFSTLVIVPTLRRGNLSSNAPALRDAERHCH